ncbi:MAG: VacJ family lipoprotein, partial [Pedobacter sp.]|nr:VacJ family lipoprotein [Pedobacter sp.]
PGKNPDPWEKFNRGVYRFNDVADRYVLKPVAKGYRAVTPELVRTGVTNFFINLRSPLVVMNDLLQGKVKQAGGDTLRFVVNSTVGVVGVVDVAARINLPVHDEDFGQTLGVWGVPSGPYLMLPFMGPSSLRDGVGVGVDAVANPRRRLINRDVDWILFGVDVVNSRASLLDLEDIIQGDRYLFIRDLYLQRREYAVKDGQVSDDPFLDDPMDDPAGEAEPEPEEAAPEAAPQETEPPVKAPDQGSLEPSVETVVTAESAQADTPAL